MRLHVHSNLADIAHYFGFFSPWLRICFLQTRQTPKCANSKKKSVLRRTKMAKDAFDLEDDSCLRLYFRSPSFLWRPSAAWVRAKRLGWSLFRTGHLKFSAGVTFDSLFRAHLRKKNLNLVFESCTFRQRGYKIKCNLSNFIFWKKKPYLSYLSIDKVLHRIGIANLS